MKARRIWRNARISTVPPLRDHKLDPSRPVKADGATVHSRLLAGIREKVPPSLHPLASKMAHRMKAEQKRALRKALYAPTSRRP